MGNSVSGWPLPDAGKSAIGWASRPSNASFQRIRPFTMSVRSPKSPVRKVPDPDKLSMREAKKQS